MNEGEFADRLHYEKQLWSEGYKHVIGLDEVGRGCLAGPVVAAGVIFKEGTEIPEIRDSKILSNKDRNYLSEEIKKQAVAWSIQEGSLEEINRLNILWASLETMQKCVDQINPAPDYLLVDGNHYIDSLIPFSCIVRGDDSSMSIAAASILAKVYRDELMRTYHEEFPEYGWDTNVGYPTKVHRQALLTHGYTKYHRTSFSLGTTEMKR